MEAAIHVKPFGFDRVFRFAASEPTATNNGELLKQIAALQAEIDQLTAERDAMLARARADGFEAGLAQAHGERGTALLAAADAVHAALDDVDARLAQGADSMMKEAAEVALAAAEMLAGHAIEAAPARAVDEALARVIQQIGRGTPLTVRVHPDLHAEVDRLIAVRDGHDRRKLSVAVIGDESIAIGDALIFWDEGGLAVDSAQRRAAVLAELGALIDDRIAS